MLWFSLGRQIILQNRLFLQLLTGIIGQTHTPFSDSLVTIKINGMEVNLSDGNKLKECYFSRDGGSSSVLIQDIIAGDTLYWNGSIAGYQLDGTDDLDISYQKSSLD